MTKLAILIVEDEPEVRDALIRDVAPLETQFRIEAAENVEDARAALQGLGEAGQQVALVLCDHMLPGVHGVDFLIELNNDKVTKPARKVLVTGQAGLEDTIRAVNDADLDHYIAKPWEEAELQDIVREQLTEYVARWVDDLLPYVPILNGAKLMAIIAARGFDR